MTTIKPSKKTGLYTKTKKDLSVERLSIDELSNNAVITHYLHNKDQKQYKREAENILENYAGYERDEKQNHLVAENALQHIMFETTNIPFPENQDYKFTFIDLFAGVGGFRLAMQGLGGKCVFTSEWNKDAQRTYKANFGEVPFGDITKDETKKFIPKKFDVLCGGFPCQAFSVAGYRKGFSDTRGTLFFDIEQIVKTHKPKALFLENVKNLQSHDKGRTFQIMLDVLENKLKYRVYFKVLNTMTHSNIPQNRERIFIVAFDPKQVSRHSEFKFPDQVPLTRKIHDILEHEKKDDIYYYQDSHQYSVELKRMMINKDTVYQWRRMYVRENKSNVCPTLTANMGAGGHNVPLILDDYGIRKLTPRECFLFQGYPNNFVLPKSANSKLYMQAGNSVTVPLIERIGKEITKLL